MFIRQIGVAALLLALLAIPVAQNSARAQDAAKAPETKKDPTDEKSIRALIMQLGDDSFETRDAADKRLAAIGEAALELLQKAAKESADAEVRERAGQLVQRIESQFFREVLAVPGHQNTWATRIAVTPDGTRVVSTGFDGMRLWDAKTGKAVLTYHTGSAFWSMAVAPDGSQVIAGGNDTIARVFELVTGKELRQLKGHRGPIWGAALFAGNKRAVTGGWDKSLRLWMWRPGRNSPYSPVWSTKFAAWPSRRMA
jgi:hypothetical protein